ncbi:hypothetical protein BC833DRAFT_538868 [Globomyces pollinis-pini]|nr:hypothetical protein BC833DRAFT_538868 [Globomyces pollinis-pini]
MEKDKSNHKPFVCLVCDKHFNTTQQLKTHSVVHSTERPFECEFCSQTFKRKHHLTDHIILHTTPSEKCPICFKDVKLLKKHMKAHEDERPYQCTICKKQFKRKEHLKDHSIIHENITEFYNCSICNQKFKHAYQLNFHLKNHSDDRPFSCSQCEKTFKRKDGLKVHEKIHTQKLDYTCEYCGKSFLHSSNYKDHLRRHLTPKRCPKRSTTPTQSNIDDNLSTNDEGKMNIIVHPDQSSFVVDSSLTPNVDGILNVTNPSPLEIVEPNATLQSNEDYCHSSGNRHILESKHKLNLEQDITPKRLKLITDNQDIHKPESNNLERIENSLHTTKPGPSKKTIKNRRKRERQKLKKAKILADAATDNAMNKPVSLDNNIGTSKDDKENDTVPVINETTVTTESITDNQTNELIQHLNPCRKTNINNSTKIFECGLCQLQFDNLTLLKQHSKTHDFKCGMCSKTLTSHYGLLQHLNTHSDKRERFYCTYTNENERSCRKSYLSEASLKVHIRTKHLNIKPFQCPHCEYQSSFKHVLLKHIKTHDKIDPLLDFSAPSIEPSPSSIFSQISGFQNNEVVETRKFKCFLNNCQARFKRMYDLNRHVQSAFHAKDHVSDVIPTDDDMMNEDDIQHSIEQ